MPCNPAAGNAVNKSAQACPLGDNMGALVRLVFHDAAGGGGPNGCIDFGTADNNGLQEVVASLTALYNAKNYSNIISKADLFVLAANTAIFYASLNYTGPLPRVRMDPLPPGAPLNLTFRYGRVDAATCNDTGMMPSPGFLWADLKTFFGGRFGMTNQGGCECECDCECECAGAGACTCTWASAS